MTKHFVLHKDVHALIEARAASARRAGGALDSDGWQDATDQIMYALCLFRFDWLRSRVCPACTQAAHNPDRCYLLHACDISSQAKPHNLALAW